MGSLLPAWDNEQGSGVPPPAFQDYPEAGEPEGYFATYARLRKKSKDPAGAAGEPSTPTSSRRLDRLSSTPARALARTSMPAAQRGATPPTLSRRSLQLDTPRTPSAVAAAPSAFERNASATTPFSPAAAAGPRRLQRLASMPVTAGERHDILADLLSPRPRPLSGSSARPGSPGTPSSPLDVYRTTRPQRGGAGGDHGGAAEAEYGWWRHLDSAALNDAPDVGKAYKGSFKANLAPGQAMHFRVPEEEPVVVPAH